MRSFCRYFYLFLGFLNMSNPVMAGSQNSLRAGGIDSIHSSWAWTIEWQAPLIRAEDRDRPGTWFPPDAPSLRILGRTDRTPEGKVLLHWPSSSVEGRFTGTSLRVQLEDGGQVDYQVIIDGDIKQSKLLDTSPGYQVYTLAEHLPQGEHSFELFRRTESFIGISQIDGFLVDQGHRLLPPLIDKKLRIDFYGDSQTVGACNACPGADQWDDIRQHNHLLSYAAITSRVLEADSQMTAVSGIGLTLGYQSFTMPEIWNRLHPDPTSAMYDLKSRRPDVVVINLGQNDWSKSVGKDFEPAYAAFVQEIRATAPNALIVCLLGVMQVGWDQSAYPSYIQNLVTKLRNQGDDRIVFYGFKGQTKEHPRVADHLQMAEELVELLRLHLGWN